MENSPSKKPNISRTAIEDFSHDAGFPSSAYLDRIRETMKQRPDPFKALVRQRRIERRLVKSIIGRKEYIKRKRRGEYIGINSLLREE